ncbi:MAG: aminoacyl-tRNA hydrolase [Rhodospirillales bacterium]|nr:aminoacyl-tRNA hydrolase [Rhodospirillales bacterium]
MLLWVGLGNPEPGMVFNRHNIGFMALDVIAARHGLSAWRRRFRGLFAEGSVGGERMIALKPLTYMNLSGESVQAAVAFYKLSVSSVTVFHDEIDLAPGKVRVKQDGGSAGHNGLRSIDRALGERDYWRVRLGVGHPGEKERVLGHVLGDFSRADREKWLEALLGAVAEEAPLLVAGRSEEFMSKVASAVQRSG